MTVSNPWVNYITRSYQQIKASLIQGLVTKTPEMTDHSESNILIILISMFSGVAEMLGYYIDNAAREAFILSARRYDSMVKLTRLLDYRIKAANPSTCDITLNFSAAVPLNGSVPYQLPVGIQGTNATGVPFISQNTSPLDIAPGSLKLVIPFIQHTVVLNQVLGTSDGTTPNQSYILPDGYVDKSMSLVIGGVNYTLADTFAYSFPSSTHFIVEVDEDGVASVVLGDGVNAVIPPTGAQLVASFRTTLGASGNLAAQTITTLVTNLTPYLPVGVTVTISNMNASTGGAGYEGIEDIRKRAPLSIRTLYRAVTEKDYVDITLLHPGVSKADTNYECGKFVDIFVVPINGGIAQSGLLTSIEEYLDEFKMVGTFPVPRPAGTTNIVLEIDITAKFRADPTLLLADAKAALKNFFELKNQNINGNVYKSVLDATLHEISTVEFLNILTLTTKPYARLVINESLTITQSELDWVPNVNSTCTTESNWQVTYLYDPVFFPAGEFLVTRNGIVDGNVAPNTLHNSPSGDMSMTFNLASVTDYADQQSWEFTTYPYNEDLDLNDFTIPAVRLDSTGEMLDVTLNIIQQLNP